MRAIAIVAVLLASSSAARAQNCVITGGINNGSITQNCTVVSPAKLTFEPAIAEELANKLPPGKPVHVEGVGSQSDRAVAAQYAKFLQDKRLSVTFSSTVMLLSPQPEHKISIVNPAAPTVLVVIAPSVF